MFQNLIESGSHRRDLARRGRFLLGTLALYSALVCAAGVASVSAYNARLDAQTYEVAILPPWALPAQAQPPDHNEPPARPSRGNAGELSVRRDLVLDLNTTPRTPPPVSSEATNVKTIPQGPFIIGRFDRDAPIGGPHALVGTGSGGGVPTGTNDRPQVVVATPNDPPPPEVARPTPAPTPKPVLKLSQILSSKVVSKPAPPYPQIAKIAGVQGTVNVEILVDEQGRVVSATAKDGPVMLREAARQAALLARFTPTQLNGEPVKVSGVISYNFTLR
ncbi:MAG: TonB family protein [Acidobacteriota bacterium]|nr:TonB family protein [Acidobacteriota bacterium]